MKPSKRIEEIFNSLCDTWNKNSDLEYPTPVKGTFQLQAIIKYLDEQKEKEK
jgi:hypothetical protein